MRRLKLVLGVAALMVAIMAASAAPAAAQELFISGDGLCDDIDNDEDCFDDFFFLDCEDFDEDSICDFEDFDNGFFDVGDVGAIEQDVEQEAESGEVDQSFEVVGGGDNSNQTVSTQGVANTGNAQNVIDVVQVGGEADDFEFEDGGSSITVSPTNTTTSSNQVNQAASAAD